MDITDLISPAMATICGGYLMPTIAVVISAMIGIACVICRGEVACLIAGMPMSFSFYWLACTMILHSEVPPRFYQELAEVSDPDYQRIIRSRMRDGRLVVGDMYAAKSEYDRIKGNRARIAIASRPA